METLSLSEIIIQKIKKEGPLSFHDFMEMALYHPEMGYYTSPGDKIGIDGDYYTSPYLTSIFGEMLAVQIEEMWKLLGERPFTIVEYGAGNGALCHDILNQLSKNEKMYSGIHYCIIEKSKWMRDKEKALLNDKVSWHNSIQEIEPFTGCILSNEVLDNFSIHKVVMSDELMEVFIDYEGGFKELLKPASQELNDYLEKLKVKLPGGFCTEINMQAIEWVNEISLGLKKGFVITIDYGYPSQILYSPARSGGTLMCYHHHTANENPYEHIGEQDITAHVNFSALSYFGLFNGLKCCGFTDQHNFLHSLGLAHRVRNEKVDSNRKFVLLHTLLTDIGSKIKILIQQKGLQQPLLSGLRLSQDIV